jgi:hypothetical protein
VWIGSGALAASAAIFCAHRFGSRPMTHTPAPELLTVEQFREVSELATLRLEVSDVLESRVGGFTGGASALVLVRGDVDLSVDLSKAELANLDPRARTATLKLPPPAASRPRVNHAATRVVAVQRTGLWSILPAGLATAEGVAQTPEATIIARVMRDGETRIGAAAARPEASRRARSSAERVLTERARQLGWTARVVWIDGVEAAKR